MNNPIAPEGAMTDERAFELLENVWEVIDRQQPLCLDCEDLLQALDYIASRLAQKPSAEPVAEVVQRAPYLDRSPQPGHSLKWDTKKYPSCEDDIPTGTKLYISPPTLPEITAEDVVRAREAYDKQYSGWAQVGPARIGGMRKVLESYRDRLAGKGGAP